MKLKKLLCGLFTVVCFAGQPAAIAGSYGTVANKPSSKATYASTSAPVARVASATDLFYIQGSSSKTVRIQKIYMTASCANLGSFNHIYLIKRSTANSGGTSTTPTIVPLDSNNAAATAVVRDYTANPTPGSAVGNIVIKTLMGPPAPGILAGFAEFLIFDADKFGQALTLRGTAEGVAVNANGVTLTGTTTVVGFTVVFTEE